jgi:hypothetical protein
MAKTSGASKPNVFRRLGKYFADVRAVMGAGGVAMIGMGESDTDNRAIESVEKSLFQNILLNCMKKQVTYASHAPFSRFSHLITLCMVYSFPSKSRPSRMRAMSDNSCSELLYGEL